MKAIILFAHGARDPAWAAPFEAAAQLLRQRSHASAESLQVRTAYLEFMQPNLSDAGAELVVQGCTSITVVPMFLGAGGHVRKDLPRLVGELITQYPAVDWKLSPAVGETAQLIQALADTAWQLSQSET